MQIGDKEIIAKCYIYQEGNEEDICYLAEENLYIKNKGVISHFPLDAIMNITFKKKIFLMPIVFGGIIAPFSMIALFNGYYNLWIMLSIMMGGLALVYYGIEGSETLSVQTNVKEYDFFLKSISLNLKSFVSFVINYQHRGQDALLFYFSLENSQWEQALTSNYIEPISPLKLSASRLSTDDEHIELAINISETSATVNYVMDKQLNKLVPTIEKRISIDDIIIP